VRLSTDLRRSQLRSRITELEEKLASGQPSSSRSEHINVLPPLSIPELPMLLERKDFPKVRFWTVKEWNDYRTTQQRRNEAVHKLAFITTNTGGPISNTYLEQMSEMARTLFNELHARGLAPSTWKAKSKIASDFFINSIVIKFPELRWCEGGTWKAEAFAVTRYPDCSRRFFNGFSLVYDREH
jgi:hypothetical protein